MKTTLHKVAPLGVCLSSLLFLPSGAPAINSSSVVKARTVLKTTESWDGKKIVYPEGEAEVTGMVIEIAPGGQTGWHLHPVPSFALLVQGKLDVNLKDGRVKHLKAGDALAEVTNTLHNGRNVGKNTVKLAVFYAGVKGKSLTVKEPAAPLLKSNAAGQSPASSK